MIFDITKNDLARLGADLSVKLLQKLVWADATSSDISKNLINIPTAINVRDGGIDGDVSEAERDSQLGIIKKGKTRYQVKSGNFSLSNDSDIKELLFKGDGVQLKDRIKSCLDDGGTLVFVFTGYDNPDRTEDGLEIKLREKLKDVEQSYENAKIEIWRQNTILGFLEHFPSIRLEILEIRSREFYFHEQWGELDDMKPNLHLGEKQKEYLENFRKNLRINDKPVHIRVIGEPGIGKTKLVNEVTNQEDLSPLTIYVEDPTKLTHNDFLSDIQNKEKTFCVLIVDECNHTEQAKIWNQLKDKSPNIKLITIYNEPDPYAFGGATIYRDPPALDDEQIGEILEEYGVQKEESGKWIDFCKPSPRAAHIVGLNLRENPEDILKSPDTVPVWDRYIAGPLKFESEEFRRRRTVLLWVSLFKKFGFEGRFTEEAKKIWEKIRQYHGIEYGDFLEIIKKLKNMKILQGQKTLYITPKILHIYLWTKWWEEFGGSDMFHPKELIIAEETSIPESEHENLLSWYFEMFQYASQSPKASEVVKELLGPGGIFENDEMFKTRLGPDFFLNLAKAEPEAALSFLKRKILTKNKDELKEFQLGRREIVWALEKIVFKKEFFIDAARVLLALAEGENENISNNATGVFVSLFLPAPGKVSHTQLPPKDRIPILHEAFNSNSHEKILIAIKACDAALQLRYFTRIVGKSEELSSEEQGWAPTSPGETLEYCKEILNLLINKLEILEESEKNEAVKTILNNTRSLIIIPEFSDKILNILEEMFVKYNIDNELIVENILNILRFEKDNLSNELKIKLNQLEKKVTGDDYHSRMKRFVGMDIKVDWSLETINHKDIRKKDIEKLVSESLDPEILKPELEWLNTFKAKNGYQFGYELGKSDNNLKLLPSITESLKNAGSESSGFFIGGYFLAVFERDVSIWEENIGRMVNDTKLAKFVPEIIWRSGLTDKAAQWILDLIKNKIIDFSSLGHFRYGGVTSKLSEEMFLKWIDVLIHEDDKRAIFLAMDLFFGFYVHRKDKDLPKDITLKILLHENVVHKSPDVPYDLMDEYHWKEIGLKFVKQFPQHSITIAETIFENYNRGSFFGHYDSEINQVLDEISRINPEQVWKIASKYLGPPIDSRAFAIRNLIRGGMFKAKKAIEDNIPLEHILLWIEGDKEERASYIASCLPPDYSIVREFLTRYGDDDKVRRSLAANFSTESFSGNASEYYTKKLEQFKDYLKTETDSKAKSWLEFYIEVIKEDIKRSEDREEREF